MADSEEAVLLQRRARRRLVGAIALALLVVIVIPIVFDREPKPITQDLVIEIPSQDSSKFNPRLLPRPPAEAPAKAEPPASPEAPKTTEPVAALEPKAEPPKPESPKADTPKAEAAKPAVKPEAPKAVAKPEAPKTEAPKPETPKAAKAEPAKVETAKAEPASKASPKGSAGDFVVPLGLFSKPENAKRVQSEVSKAGFKVFSETVKGDKGELLRVRAGPYPSREAAEQARDKLKSKGVNVGAVVPRDQP